ncbi:MAG: single-stranded DNA-binding protein [Clostridia bacterium]|nr:single-stranded DNA-binding protein [Clostridia bacterium]
MENILTNNYAALVGELYSDFSYSHESYGECFYSFCVKIPRLSNCADIITVTASERILFDDEYSVGDKIKITGQFRSYNNYSDVGNRLILTLFAKTIEKADGLKYLNEVELNGFLCKQPVYRTTPFGREITDMLLAVNRTHNKSDYIPCIAWGRNAKFAQKLNIGDNIIVTGRMQSREYQKKVNEEIITKTAYEISVSKIEIVSQPKINSI